MMDSDGGADGPRKRRRFSPPDEEPYVLQQLVADVPVAREDADQEAYITCVESWDDHFYIGTSQGEILHYVCLHPDPADPNAEASFIFAFRLPIATAQDSQSPTALPGVQQILLLPSVSKICVLCNGVVTFYTLPELGPAYSTKVGSCNWIGGLDLNESVDEDATQEPVIMIAVQSKIMLVRIGADKARRVRDIEYPGCVAAARRDTIACVANSHSYSLLEVEQRQKIPLFPISSSEESFESGRVEDIPSRGETPQPERAGRSTPKSHGRSTSLNSIAGIVSGRQQSPRPGTPSLEPPPRERRDSSQLEPPQERRPSVQGRQTPEANAKESETQSATQKPLPAPPKPVPLLKPHIFSPTPSEFLLVTGTEKSDPGVGVFVNLEGEVTMRGTLQFETYPEAIVLDGGTSGSPSGPSDDNQEGYILSIIKTDQDQRVLEVQRWDLDPGEGERSKSRISIPANGDSPIGIHWTVSSSQMKFSQVTRTMQMVRLKSAVLGTPPGTPPDAADPRTRASIEQFQKEKELFDSQEFDSDTGKPAPSVRTRAAWEAVRNREEQRFASNLGKVKSNIVLWSGSQLWSVVRGPLVLHLENRLQAAQSKSDNGKDAVDRRVLRELMNEVETIVPKTEADFLGLRYIKQKASLLLFIDLISSELDLHTPEAIVSTEEALRSGDLDPRIILLLVPLLSGEVVQGPQGIWIYGGLPEITEEYLDSEDLHFNFGNAVFGMLVRYLQYWQKKRGYGSVPDDIYVFNSVDVALLHLLLESEKQILEASESKGSTRTELNKLVDNWKGDFEKAVELLEKYKRLYVLSRLYQSRKASKDVLRTWRRIIEGEKDVGGELSIPAAEAQVRKYLIKIRDAQLVEEYGPWLASRNPQLGVQVFADDNSRVKFGTSQVIALLKKRAPDAVQFYLEHLVFTKNLSQYADDLIAYYLDTVLSVLESSAEARSVLAETYSTYRALQPPKPSYLFFITENAPPEPWWQCRLRLLQLLGGGGPRSQFTSAPSPKELSYSIPAVLERIEPFKNELVSESIILGGRQGHHREALRLLTHGLGDYDTAIRYCIFGGPSSTTSAAPPIPDSAASLAEIQKSLFAHLLREFLQISDPADRIERTSDLLARFAPLFDVREVLAAVPEEWGVDILGPFLVRVLRGLVAESREAMVQRALSAGLNLRIAVEFLDQAEKIGGWIEDGEGVRKLKDLSVVDRPDSAVDEED